MLVHGPMAKDIDSLVYIYKLLFNNQKMLKSDPFCLPLPFNTEKMNITDKKLRFGYFWSHSDIGELGYLKRSVMEAVAILERKGYECINISEFVPDLYKIYTDLFLKLTCPDGGRSVLHTLYFCQFIFEIFNSSTKTLIITLFGKKSLEIRNRWI